MKHPTILNIASLSFVVPVLQISFYPSPEPTPDPAVPEVLEGPNPNKQFTEDTISQEQIEFLDNLESLPINFDKIVLPNGMTLGEFKKINLPKEEPLSNVEESGSPLRKN